MQSDLSTVPGAAPPKISGTRPKWPQHWTPCSRRHPPPVASGPLRANSLLLPLLNTPLGLLQDNNPHFEQVHDHQSLRNETALSDRNHTLITNIHHVWPSSRL